MFNSIFIEQVLVHVVKLLGSRSQAVKTRIKKVGSFKISSLGDSSSWMVHRHFHRWTFTSWIISIMGCRQRTHRSQSFGRGEAALSNRENGKKRHVFSKKRYVRKERLLARLINIQTITKRYLIYSYYNEV